MEQYQSMAKSIEGLKRPIVHIALVSLLTHLIILGTGIYLGKKENLEEFSSFETCLYGMKSLFENNPKKEFFNKSVLEETKDHQFYIDSISLVKVIDSYHCDVIAKDSKGHRSYRITLEKNSKFAHFYRILDVKGQKITSKYQWRANL